MLLDIVFIFFLLYWCVNWKLIRKAYKIQDVFLYRIFALFSILIPLIEVDILYYVAIRQNIKMWSTTRYLCITIILLSIILSVVLMYRLIILICYLNETNDNFFDYLHRFIKY